MNNKSTNTRLDDIVRRFRDIEHRLMGIRLSKEEVDELWACNKRLEMYIRSCEEPRQYIVLPEIYEDNKNNKEK